MRQLHSTGLFDPTARGKPATAYYDATKVMCRSDLFALCKATLEASAEPLDTRQLARHVITAEGWDGGDTRLRLAIIHKVGAAMGRCVRRGMIQKVGERDRAALWRLV